MKMLHLHRHWKEYKIILFTFIVLCLVIGVGFFGSRWQDRFTDMFAREKLADQSKGLAAAFDPALVKQLHFSESDSGSAIYQRIQNQIKKYGNLIEQRDIYTLALRNNTLRFGPNTLSDSDVSTKMDDFLKDKKLSKENVEKLHRGETVVIGPLGNENEFYLSALSPVLDPGTGNILMIVGIDFFYDMYKNMLLVSKRPVIIMTIIFVVIFITGAVINLTWLKRKEHLLQHLETGVTLILGLLLTFTVTFVMFNREQIERNEIYTQISNNISNNVIGDFYDIHHNLNILAAFHESSDYVDDHEFALFTDPLSKMSKSWWYYWTDYIHRDDLEAYEEKARKEKNQDFRVWEWSEAGERVHVSERPVYYPVRHLSPAELNPLLIGFDMASNKHRQDALYEAISGRMMTATQSTPLYINDNENSGILILKPAFKDEVKDYPCEFSCDLLGIAVSAIHLPTILENAIRGEFGTGTFLCVHLVDLSDPAGMRILTTYPQENHESCPVFVEKESLQQFIHYNTYPFFMFGRPFSLVIHPTPEFTTTFPLRSTRLAAVTGMLLTLLLTTFIGYLRNREYRLANLVSLRTKELKEREEKYRLLTDNSIDTIWLMDTELIFRFVSPAVVNMLGYTPSEMIGKPFGAFCNKKNLVQIKETIQTSKDNLPKNEGITFEAELICRDGKGLPVEIGEKLLLDDHGNVTGIQGIARDITQRKFMENQLRERLKELACISAIREETLKDLPENVFCQRIIQHVKNAMQFTDLAFPVIELEGRIYSPGRKNITNKNKLQALIQTGPDIYGRLLVIYTDYKPFILPEEQELINNIADSIGLWFEWKRTQNRETHTKQVLLGIRNVNQLIIKETDRMNLIQKACINLTETLGYEDTWISLTDNKNRVITTEHAGHDVCDFVKHAHKLKAEKLPACIRDVLKSNQLEIYHGIESACGHCSFSNKIPEFAIFSAPLSHEEKIYGILTVGVPEEFADLKEEQNLFIEVAEDIGFALYKIELEEKRNQSKQEILRNLHEKNILLQEIHHRVKNNLNVISSLLKLQSRKITNKQDAIEAFQNSSNRVQAMALVHKKLYDTKNFDAVNMKSYLSSLAGQLVSVYRHNTRIQIQTEVEDVALDINTAVPCGLILNELISNTLKHAFRDRESGKIYLKVFKPDKVHVEIQVKDNGVGFPKGEDPMKRESLGLHLVELLTDQINGILSIQSGKGTTFSVRFPQKRKG